MLKRNLLRFIAILFVAILVYFAKTNFSEYNIEKSISACVMSQKMTSESFDLEKSRKYCEGQVKKQKEY